MGVIVPVGFGICKMMWQLSGSSDVFISTFGYDGDVDEDPVVDAGEVNVILKATGRPCNAGNMSSSYIYLGVECMRMTATGPISGTAPESQVGTSSLSPCPPNCSLLIQKSTTRGGRKGKGRMYVPIFNKSESDIEKDGSILTGNLATLQGYWGGAFTALAASDVKPALLHSDGSTPDLITAWTVKPLIATQRRRLRR